MHKERLIFVPAICESCRGAGFNIVDKQDEIEPLGTIHTKKDFFDFFNELKEKLEEQDLNNLDGLNYLISLTEQLHLLSIPDIEIKTEDSPQFTWSKKTEFAKATRLILIRFYRLRMWLEEDGKPFVFVPENSGNQTEWIDIFIIPSNQKQLIEKISLLDPNKLYSKQQARDFIQKSFQGELIDEFDQVRLLSEVNNLENFREQTEEEIEEDQAKQN